MSDELDMDLRHLPYMPLKIDRLRRSKAWLRCKRRPDLAFYMLNLWMRAWHEVPAGTIEADDDILADAAMCTPDQWQVMKDDLLHGWELIGDRYVHSIVTEIATEAAEKLNRDRRRTKAARASKSHSASDGCNSPVTAPVASHDTEIATEAVTGAKGRRREEEEKEEPASAASSAGAAREPAMPRADYGALEDKLRDAAGLSNDPSPGLMTLAPILGLLDGGASLEADILPVLRAKSAAGKRGRSWAFYVDAIREGMAVRSSAANVVPISSPASRETPADVWALWVAGFKRQRSWLHALGPKPDEAGCRAPPEILAEHGFQLIDQKETA